MEFKLVKEGKVEVMVPNVKLPEDGRAYGFYNPRMSFDRNISVTVVKTFAKIFKEKLGKLPRVCDLLTATGIRGIRYAKEAKLSDVTINDVNEKAIELAKKNVEGNQVKIQVKNIDGSKLLLKEKFDIIDIDPFGSPFQFIDPAARSLEKFSLLCVTATDLPVLFGIYPKTCYRRYSLKSKRCQFENELGLRILVSYIIRELAKYELAFKPVLSYARKHWMRIYGIVEKSSTKTDQILKEFKHLMIDDFEVGNVYMGNLQQEFFVKSVLEDMKKRDYALETRMLEIIKSELDIPFYYDLTWVSKHYKKKIPKVESIVENLNKNGFKASRTHFSPTGIKANVELNDLLRLLD